MKFTSGIHADFMLYTASNGIYTRETTPFTYIWFVFHPFSSRVYANETRQLNVNNENVQRNDSGDTK